MSTVTPKRIYCRSNICVLCGFSFVERSVSATGEEKIQKHFTQKLKLNSERIEKIHLVIGDFEREPSCEDSNGVCVKCFRRVENVFKMKKEIENQIESLNKSRKTVDNTLLTLPSPRKQTVTKRLLRSPHSGQEAKLSTATKLFPTTVVRKYPVQLSTLQPLQSSNRKTVCSPKQMLPGIPLLPGVENLPSSEDVHLHAVCNSIIPRSSYWSQSSTRAVQKKRLLRKKGRRKPAGP
ncbi:uncharacterized protein LOC124275108 [Haliotis rubra]|uniref:uncharacterized protein LOC124275108 n=1 Tax=Haliotis rubra TaxID=36100 RepID=UPI001EE51B98|nr:uncharacterized protein LOC124275108 [Haliotis rubra]